MKTLPFQMSVRFFNEGISSQLATPASLKVAQQEFAHDVATLEYWGGSVNAPDLASGTPLYIAWGRAPHLRSFYGYVNHATRTNNSLAKDNMSRNATCITAVGASWPMKQTATTAYVNMTSTQIVQQIATQFGLATNMVPHQVLWPTKQQGGLSYWQFCVQLMYEIGYTFFCNGIELEAFPRNTDPSSLTSLAAVYDYRRDPVSLPVFNPMLGATNPSGGQLMNRQGGGIDPRTGQVIYSYSAGTAGLQGTVLGETQDTAPFLQTEVVSADTKSQLDAKVQGSALSNQLYLTASAYGAGNAQIAQGSYIFVQNANGSQNGLWMVTSAEHVMTARNYTMSLELGRDSLGASTFITMVPITELPPQGVLFSDGTWGALAA